MGECMELECEWYELELKAHIVVVSYGSLLKG